MSRLFLLLNSLAIGIMMIPISELSSTSYFFYFRAAKLTSHSGMAPPPNPRPPLWHRLLPPLLPHPQHHPGVLLLPPRRRHGLRSLRLRRRRPRPLASNPPPPHAPLRPLDSALPLALQPANLPPHRPHRRALPLPDPPSHPCRLQASSQARLSAQRRRLVPPSRGEPPAIDVLSRVQPRTRLHVKLRCRPPRHL